MSHNPELTAEFLYNQEWKPKLIIGYGAGIYIGTGDDAKFIAKCSSNEIAIDELMVMYKLICIRHNNQIKKDPYKKKFRLFAWIRKQQWGRKKFTYPDPPAETINDKNNY